MSRRASTRRWVEKQAKDPYVRRRDADGYRSRAAFKLQDLLDRDRLLKKGNTVVDLGAAPGGWSEIAKKIVGIQGTVVSVDILEMDPIEDVFVIQGDCRSADVIDEISAKIEELSGDPGADLVLSDMAPNITGIKDADEANFLELAESVLAVASAVLKPNGALLLKLFQSPGTDAFVKALTSSFKKVVRRKPPASRKQSKEFYVVASGYTL